MNAFNKNTLNKRENTVLTKVCDVLVRYWLQSLIHIHGIL